MKLTELGQELRKLRMEANMLLGDLADSVGISASMLSGIEYGRKRPTLEFCENVVTALKLDDISAERFRRILSQEIEVFSVRPANDVEREAMVLFARHLSFLNEDGLAGIREVLTGKPNKEIQ